MMTNKPSREKNGSVLQMIQTLEICSTALENNEASPLLRMAAKALGQLQSHSDTVMAEAVDWKEKYEQIGQLYNELVEKIGDLAEENGQLLIKCQQLEVDERMLNDMLLEKLDDLAEDNEKLEFELVSYKVLFEASPMQDTSTTVQNISSFSGDVYRQLDQFEHSLDMELEDFQQLEFSKSSSVIVMASWDENEKNTSANDSEDVETNDSESEQASSSCHDVLVGDRPFEIGIVTPLQNETLGTIKDTPGVPDMYPLQLLHRMFQTQTQQVCDAVPTMTRSNSLVSLPSDYSTSTRSSSDLLSLTPTRKTTKIFAAAV